MNRSGWRSYLTALLTAIIAGVSLLSLSSLPAWAAKAGTIKEFPIPTKSAPIGITAGPDGNLWFTEITNGEGDIGRITPSGRFTVFPIPTANSGPSGRARWQPLVHRRRCEQHRAHHHRGQLHRFPHPHGQ